MPTPHNEQMTQSQIKSAWVNPIFPEEILDRLSQSNPNNSADNDAVIVQSPNTGEVDEFDMADTETTPPIADEDIITLVKKNSADNDAVIVQSPNTGEVDGFVMADTETTRPIADEDIITLVNKMKLTLPGLPESFISGYYLISPGHRPAEQPWTWERKLEGNAQQSKVDFAKRRLHALLSIHINTSNPAIQALNEWHVRDEVQTQTEDCALAGTAFYFDEKRNQLIIRHAPIEMIGNAEAADELLDTVTQRILDSLQLSADEVKIEHIIPAIIPGRAATFASNVPFFANIVNKLAPGAINEDSKHIVVKLRRVFNHEGNVMQYSEHTLDPRTNTYDTETYHSIGAQSFSNSTDCGRYVAILANSLASLLAEKPGLAIEEIVTQLKCSPALRQASHCKSVDELSRLLSQPSMLWKQPHTPNNQTGSVSPSPSLT